MGYGIALSITFCVAMGSAEPFPSDPALEEWRAFSRRPEARECINWLRCHARGLMTGNRCDALLPPRTPRLFGALGVFITIVKGRAVRGCYGAFDHRARDAKELLIDYLEGALMRDARYRPLLVHELESAQIILTITSRPRPAGNIEAIDTARHGVFLECDGEARVYVPAELRATGDIEREARRLNCQVYEFNAVTIR